MVKIQIKPALGQLCVREVTPGVVSRALAAVAKTSGPSAATEMSCAVSSGVRARGAFLPTLMRAIESRAGFVVIALSSMASANIPERQARGRLGRQVVSAAAAQVLDRRCGVCAHTSAHTAKL